MNLFAFELGRKKNLCFAELIAVLGKKSLVERNLDTAVFKLEETDPQKLQDRLGGTIKIIKIFDELPSFQENQIKTSIQKQLEPNFKDRSGKIPFSISILSFKNPRHINIKGLLNFSKKILKSLGLNSRFVNKNFKNTKPSTIYKAKVIQKGIDINIIQGENRIFIGKTVSIQNIDAYSKRDYEKPKRAPQIGMLPPKLAQIMINLAGLRSRPGGGPASTIYDPFCGTGTVLTEGMLMNKTVVGSDIDLEMTEYSAENCKWLKKEFETSAPFRIFERDARFLTQKQLPEKIDAVITEGYLGKLVTKLPSEEEREKIFRELALLHLNWLRAVHSSTPKNCPIVMCVTAYRTPKKIEHFPKFEELATEAGYKIEETFPYDRPDQIVARDIVLLSKR